MDRVMFIESVVAAVVVVGAVAVVVVARDGCGGVDNNGMMN